MPAGAPGRCPVPEQNLEGLLKVFCIRKQEEEEGAGTQLESKFPASLGCGEPRLLRRQFGSQSR